MSTKEKVLQYLEYKGINKNEFYKISGLSQGFLTRGGGMTAESVKTIVSTFPDLSLEWLVMDRGPMLVSPGGKDGEIIGGVLESNRQLTKVLDIISEQQSTIAEQARMISKLTQQLEKKDALPEGSAECADVVSA